MVGQFNVIYTILASIAAAVTIGGGAFSLGRWFGRRFALKALKERDQFREELRRTKVRISDAITGDIFTRAVGPAEQELHDRLGNAPKALSIINFKGGVGKTTLALNLGAFFADTRNLYGCQNKRVLFVDLDYQGSLSGPLASMIGDEPRNTVWSMFEDDWLPEHVMAATKAVNHELIARGSRFLCADFVLAQREERLKFDWALRNGGDDLRFRIANFLASPDAAEFDLVIFDCPPRQTLLTVNALCASTHFLTPTKLDRIAARAVGPLFANIKELKPRLWPNLSPAGIVGTMTQHATPNQNERATLLDATNAASESWGAPVSPFASVLQTKVPIASAAGQDFAYFDENTGGAAASPHMLFSVIGKELAGALGYELRDPSGSDKDPS